MKKKIVVVSPFITPLLYGGYEGGAGGAERQLILIAQGLSSKDFDVTFICKPYEYEKRGITNHNWNIVLNKYRYFGHSKLYLLVDGIKLVHQIIKSKPNYVTMRAGGEWLLIPILIASFFSSFQTINFLQIDREVNPKQWPNLKTKLKSKFYLFLLRKVTHIFCQTQFQEEMLYQLTGKKATQINNIAGTIWDNTPIAANACDLFWAGNNSPKKRFELLLEIAKLIPNKTFFVAMNGANELTNMPILPSNVQFLGQLSPREVETYFFNCKLFINTSSIEGFPNTFLQAWQYGKPVITTGIDPDGIIKKNQLGSVIKVDAYSDAILVDNSIENILANENLYAQLSQNAKNFVNKGRSVDETCSIIINKILT